MCNWPTVHQANGFWKLERSLCGKWRQHLKWNLVEATQKWGMVVAETATDPL